MATEKISVNQSGQNGGKRPGAGRKKGVKNIKTQEAVAQAEVTGIMPLDYMLQVMRDVTLETRERMGAAAAAAPYVHAKLSSIEVTGKDGGAVEIATIERRIVDSK